MEKFQIHSIDSAPEKSRPALEALARNFGFIPNAAATMAGSPALINSFIATFGNFHAGALNEAEKQTVLLTNAVALACPWTVAFHSTMALKAGVPAEDVAAIRVRRSPADSRHAALSALAKALIETKGHSVDAELERLVAAGYARSQALEVIAAIAISTMASTTANIARTPLEERFKPQEWQEQ